MGDNGKHAGVSFPEGTIGRSIFEDMWPRHEGMPDLSELVDAAENADGVAKANGTWDDHLWDARELRRRRATSALTPKQKRLIQLGEAVVALVKSAKEFVEDEERGIGMLAGTPVGEGGLAELMEPAVDGEVGVDEVSSEGTEQRDATRIIRELFFSDRWGTEEDPRSTAEHRWQRPVLPPPETAVAAEPALASALHVVGPRSFNAILHLAHYGCPDRELFAYYYALRVECGVDDPKTQPWAVLSADKALQESFAAFAAEATAAGYGSPRDATKVPGWFSFADGFDEHFDDATLDALCRMDNWVFANAVAGGMLAKGDPYAAQAREYAAYVFVMTADRARRRGAMAAAKAFDDAAAASLARGERPVSDDADEAGVDALMDEMESRAGSPVVTPAEDPALFGDVDAFISAEESVEVVRECLATADAAAKPETGGFHRDPSNKWIATFAAAFRRKLFDAKPEFRAVCLAEVTKQMLFVGIPRGRLYEHLYWHMREEFEEAGAPMERWGTSVVSSQARWPHRREQPWEPPEPPATATTPSFAVTPNLAEGLPKPRPGGDESLYGFISSDVADIETVGVQLRAAAAIANASRTEGEVWAALFLSAAETILGRGPLGAVRRDLGADWWESTLEEVGVGRALATTAWDAAERTSPLPSDDP